MKLLKSFFLTLSAIVAFSCTSDEPNNPNNGEIISPDTPVPDPTGTVLLSMRDQNNGGTELDEIIIVNENFNGEYGYTSFVDLGPVNGLGNVTTIPKEGWASQVKVVPGHGYVAYTHGYVRKYYGPSDPQCYRIYVVDYIYSTSGGIIGADIKYQRTFNGLDQELILDKTEMILNLSKISYSSYYGNYANYEGFYPKILNDSYTYYTVLNLEKNHISYDYGINFNSFSIFSVEISQDLFNSVLSSSEPLVEIDSLTVTTGYGKSKTIKVFIDRTK